jgi:hypothetical protein
MYHGPQLCRYKPKFSTSSGLHLAKSLISCTYAKFVQPGRPNENSKVGNLPCITKEQNLDSSNKAYNLKLRLLRFGGIASSLLF